MAGDPYTFYGYSWPQPYYPQPTYNPPLYTINNVGWQCPKCSACYAPTVMFCFNCVSTIKKEIDNGKEKERTE